MAGLAGLARRFPGVHFENRPEGFVIGNFTNRVRVLLLGRILLSDTGGLRSHFKTEIIRQFI